MRVAWIARHPPRLIYFGGIALHYVAFICATFYCIAHCMAFSHSDVRDNASDLQTPPVVHHPPLWTSPPWDSVCLALLPLWRFIGIATQFTTGPCGVWRWAFCAFHKDCPLCSSSHYQCQNVENFETKIRFIRIQIFPNWALPSL